MTDYSTKRNEVKPELIFTKNDYDKKIIRTLNKFYPNPISTFVISVLTNIEHTRVCKRMRNLEKYGIVKCMTASKKIRFWRLK